MPDTPSITINKVFQYRGKDEVWSNTYHFSGTTPTNDAGWATLAEAIFGEERKMVMSSVKYAGYLGYEAGNKHAVSIQDRITDGLTLTPGTFAGIDSSSNFTPGDSAFWVRWATPDRTSRGKRIYLRKYFHGGVITEGQDALVAPLKAAALTYAGKMTDGTLPGGFKVCGPQGAVAGAVMVSPFITTRTLKRRGKRPSR